MQKYLAQVNDEYLHTSALFPYARACLEFLSNRSVQCVLVTSNEEKLARAVLQKEGIESYFCHFVTGSDVIRSKPSPEIYLRALGKAGASARESLALEDSANGLRSALAAGLPTLQIIDCSFASGENFSEHPQFMGRSTWLGLKNAWMASI